MSILDHLPEGTLAAVGEDVAVMVFDKLLEPILRGVVADSENVIDDAIVEALLPAIRKQLDQIDKSDNEVPVEEPVQA